MKVKCVTLIDETSGASIGTSSWLTVGKIYHVLEVFIGERGTMDFRLLGDNKSVPAYHQARQFELISNKIPDDWCVDFLPSSFFKLIPRPWAHDGFWEAYFDGDSEAERIFEEVSRRIIESEPL